jgi:hypothetical protein
MVMAGRKFNIRDLQKMPGARGTPPAAVPGAPPAPK